MHLDRGALVQTLVRLLVIVEAKVAAEAQFYLAAPYSG
jgi:hypothetical protein